MAECTVASRERLLYPGGEDEGDEDEVEVEGGQRATRPCRLSFVGHLAGGLCMNRQTDD